MIDIIEKRPFLKWGYDFEIGRSNDGEDQFVIEYFKDKKIDRKRIVIDIGAADGLTGSNSRRLIEEEKWSAILVEPFLPFYNYLQELYRNNKEVKLLNFACDIEEKETLIYFRNFDEAKGLTSLITNWENSQKIITKKFNDLVPHEEIDFLSLDTEGKDLDILKDIDFDKYKIEIICVERIGGMSEYDQNIHSFLNNKGYMYVKTTEHNLIFVKNDIRI